MLDLILLIFQIVLKAHNVDGSTKMVAVHEGMTARDMCVMLAERNHQELGPNWTVVEKIPDLHLGTMIRLSLRINIRAHTTLVFNTLVDWQMKWKPLRSVSCFVHVHVFNMVVVLIIHNTFRVGFSIMYRSHTCTCTTTNCTWGELPSKTGWCK